MRIFLFTAIVAIIANIGFAETKSIEQALISKNYNQAIRLAEKYLNSNTSDKSKILFLLAEAYIGNANLVKAREALRSLYKQFPDSMYAKKAILRIADSYYLEYNYAQARKIYKRFLEKYNEDEFLPYAYLKLIYCEEKLGHWDAKRYYMKVLKDNYSKSIEATKLDELERRGFHFVIQVGAFVDKKNALKLVRALQKDGESPDLVVEKQNGKRFYKVRIGEFEGRNNAESKLEDLLAKGYPARIFP